MRGNLLVRRLPCSQVLFRVVQYLARSLLFLECWVCVTGHDGSVVKEVQDATRVFGKQDLLLGALDGGGQVEVVGFLELLTRLTWALLANR